MFTWICPKCGREVPPAYNDCPDCAGKTDSESVTASATPPGAVAPPQQSQPAAAQGTRSMRRPLWATGPQEPLPPAPPPSYPPPSPAAAIPFEEPPSSRPPKRATSPLFQTPAPEPSQYAVPQPHGTSKWLLGVASGVIIILIVLAMYWFFGRSQTTSAVIVAAPAKPAAAGENPLQKYIEVTGIRFSPMSKGVQIAFDIINHSDSDIVGLTGTATIFAKTNDGQQTQIGTVKFQTSMAAQGSKDMQLPFDTKLKMMELPDWQNVAVKVEITGPPGA